MSTILKALKRLEEDRPARPDASGRDRSEAVATDSGVDPAQGAHPATDPAAAAGLRERILAEEAVAQATTADERASLTSLFAGRGALLAASVGALVLTFGLIGYSVSGLRLDRTADVDPVVAASVAAAVSQTPVATAADRARAAAAASNSATSVGGIEPVPVAARANAEIAAGPDSAAAPGFVPDVVIPDNDSGIPPAELAAVSPTRAASALDPQPRREARRPIDPSPLVAVHDARPQITRVAPAPAPSPAEEMPRPAPRAEPGRREASPTTASAQPPRPTRTAPSAPPPRPRPTPTERGPAVVSARATPPPLDETRSAREPVPERGEVRVAAGRSAAEPTVRRPDRPAPRAITSSAERSDTADRSVALVERPGLPDIRVVRTKWHPSSDRRSARVRLSANDDALTLREGDAIGGLIVKEISPASVLFTAGEVEVRHRVGASGGDDR